jgi:hypothetical protein
MKAEPWEVTNECSHDHALIPGPNGVIHGCYKRSGKTQGALRVIDTGAGQSCVSGEAALKWNRTGPPGPQGEPGPTGPQGPQGEPGADGADATALWAYVASNGTLIAGSGVVSVQKFGIENDTIRYDVTFNQNVQTCAVVTGVQSPTSVMTASPAVDFVSVRLMDDSAHNTSHSGYFSLAVFC